MELDETAARGGPQAEIVLTQPESTLQRGVADAFVSVRCRLPDGRGHFWLQEHDQSLARDPLRVLDHRAWLYYFGMNPLLVNTGAQLEPETLRCCMPADFYQAFVQALGPEQIAAAQQRQQRNLRG